ncbi:MAG: hypothetical protein H7067_03515 [Burkholderiales bacterium]|nr:hypothetical protein [Opitutaceae bacterium]
MRPTLRASILFFALLSPVLGLFGQSVRVLVATGDVTLQAPGDAAPRPAVKGDVVPLGSRLVTGPASRIVLTPFPGIISMLAENSSLVVERAQSATPPGTTATLQQATLDLKTGTLVSDLEKQAGIAYDYSVKTPRGVAGARGTIYAVAVDISGVEAVLVSDGTIQITLTDGTSLTLSPGQASLTRPGQAPTAVTRLADLSPAEQAILQAVMETTLETLAAAIEAGVDLQPDALQLTLQFALDFGFEIDPELLASLQAALAAEDTDAFGMMFDRIDSLPQNLTPNSTNDAQEIVTETVPDTTPGTDNPPPDDPETTFANNLSATRKAAFLRRPSDIRAKLIQLNDADYTNLVLDPDPVTGLEFTDTELRDGLDNLAYLKVHDPAAFDFLKEVSGGSGLPDADTAPSPTDYSLSAFALMGETWSALSPEDQATLTLLGAGDSIMNTSAGYLTELLVQVDTLTVAQKTALTETGWGAYLTSIAGDTSLQSAVDTVAAYTPDQRATIKAFGLSPYSFVNTNQNAGLQAASYSYGSNPTDLLDALAALSTADQSTLRRLNLQDNLLNYRSGYSSDGETYVPLTVAERLDLTVDFYEALSPAEQTLILSIEAGHWLFENAPDEYIDSENQGLALTRSILGQVAGLSAERKEAAFTIGLLDGISLNDDRLTSAILTQALDAYLAAPAYVQRFLRDEFHGGAILDVTVGSYSEYAVRMLPEITEILSNLTTGELDTLRDMGIGETLVEENFFAADQERGDTVGVAAVSTTPTAGQQLKSMVNFYTSLSVDQKQTLTELGILGATRDNFATFLADFEGLGSLLGAYAALPDELRVATQSIPNYAYYQDYEGRSFFIPRASAFSNGSELYYVTFTSDDDLYVGATRVLRITSGGIAVKDTFTTGLDKSLYLRAADLIELNDVRFSTNIRSISMSAVTLNLYNIAFHDGARIALNSKLGGTDATGSGSGPYPTFNIGNVTGRVNFINVTYGGYLLDSASAFDTYGINIKLGTLQNPAVPPTTALPLPTNNTLAP